MRKQRMAFAHGELTTLVVLLASLQHLAVMLSQRLFRLEGMHGTEDDVLQTNAVGLVTGGLRGVENVAEVVVVVQHHATIPT